MILSFIEEVMPILVTRAQSRKICELRTASWDCKNEVADLCRQQISTCRPRDFDGET